MTATTIYSEKIEFTADLLFQQSETIVISVKQNIEVLGKEDISHKIHYVYENKILDISCDPHFGGIGMCRESKKRNEFSHEIEKYKNDRSKRRRKQKKLSKLSNYICLIVSYILLSALLNNLMIIHIHLPIKVEVSKTTNICGGGHCS